ncbi:MAG: zinc-binding alcohol dehydrogenase family protein [Proteobacteria bacterium]|nr:zinc-binding alcohol dehydrogenase family protein [Pseudomonadota bacterium]
MKAIGHVENLPVDHSDALIEFTAPDPVPGDHDLLVRPRAVSVNPVDIKVRLGKPVSGEPRILGWDASGEVVGVGGNTRGFGIGDTVWYSGQFDRPGTNAEYHLVDASLVARKPVSLDHAAAAAMPLPGITAWDCLFERLGYTPAPSAHNAANPLLLINGAGGLGSMVLQLGRLAGVEITTTAGRSETEQWCRDMGATHVIPHALAGVPDNTFPRILCAHDTDPYFAEMARLVAPQGMICAVASTRQPHDIQPLMAKSAGFAWEFVFTRGLFRTPDMARQGQILAQLATLADEGKIRTTMTETLFGLNAATLIEAHRRIESGRTIGKVVVDFGDRR